MNEMVQYVGYFYLHMSLFIYFRLKQAVEDHMPDAHATEKSQAFADTLVSYAKICMDDEFKVRAIHTN